MAQASLNFNEEALNKKSALYDLYSRLYNGMVAASTVTPPDVTTNPPLTETGEVDTAAITKSFTDYSTILMKNSAYLFASSILAIFQSGGGGGGEGGGDSTFNFISRSGDSMHGKLFARYGFEAGDNNQTVFETFVNDGKGIASITGKLFVSGDVSTEGSISVKGMAAISYADGKLVFGEDGAAIVLKDNVTVNGSISLGTLKISPGGITLDDLVYYYAGNSNLPTVDWTMKDGSVAGDLTVEGVSTLKGLLQASSGFSFSINGEEHLTLKTHVDGDNSEDRLTLQEDLYLTANKGIKHNDTYIIKSEKFEDTLDGSIPTVREEISFAAPGMIMNLGGLSDGDTNSQYISLKAGIRNRLGVTQIISPDGDGNFTNSLSAGCGNAGPKVMETYYADVKNMGVAFYRNIALGDMDGARIVTNDDTKKVVLAIPFTYMSGSVPITIFDKVSMGARDSTSLFRDQSLAHGFTSEFDTDAEMFAFKKPVEVPSISIISDKYKTRLIENALFLNDGIFIEGVNGGMRFTGDGFFSGNISSSKFASGFVGYGWAIMKDALSGNYQATFDSLTVRKKMRVYEMEVQKISATNGALWVSDSCSGDLVEELV